MEIWTLRLEMYHDWAYENGACDLIGVFEDVDMAIEVLEGCLNAEKEQGYVLGDDEGVEQIMEYVKQQPNHIHIPVYTCKYGYNNGNEQGCYVLEKKLLNDTGYVG